VVGGGERLVLLHGVGTSRVVWRRVVPLLAEERLVAAPDLPGFGSSPPAGPGFVLDAVVDTLAEALRARLAAPFDLLGNSLGGAVACVLAARRPELVRRLVLAAPAGFAPLPGPLPALTGRAGSTLIAARRVAGPPLAGSAAGRRLALLGMVAEPGRVEASDARATLRGSTGSSRIAQAIAAVTRADLRPLLAGLATPCGFMWGDRDRVVPVSSLVELRSLVPAAPAEVIRGVGHVPQLERPAEFAAAVGRLLDSITAP
jgi:pimeloyl-ACP methyl ester carboxylesterase